MTVEGFAPAKINLTLHITGQREDGFHLLDSLVGFADVGDALRFDAADDLSLTIDGAFGEGLTTGQDNLVLRAARHLGRQGARIHLSKDLPLEAGIGGGSSDAAATLRGLAQLWDVPLPDAASLAELGADVPVCLTPRIQRMQGIGESVIRQKGWPKLPAILVNPGKGVPTPAVFKALKNKENPPMPVHLPAPSTISGAISWLKAQRNDLQSAAAMTVTEVRKVLEVLEALPSAQLVRMSGSGGTCFALFDSLGDARMAGEAVRRDHPDWWVVATRIS